MSDKNGHHMAYKAEDNQFKTISEFKWCLHDGGEIEFEYNDKVFGIWPKLKRTANSPEQILISQTYIDNTEATELWCDTADEVLEYVIDGVRLRDIITNVVVAWRSI